MKKAGRVRGVKRLLVERANEQAQRGDLYSPACPSRAVLETVTSRWAVLALVLLLDGTHRFSELRRKTTGVSEKMLAQTLQALERNGFLTRTSYPVIPPRVEYALTPIGREVAAKVKGLADWVEDNLPRVMRAQTKQKAKQP